MPGGRATPDRGSGNVDPARADFWKAAPGRSWGRRRHLARRPPRCRGPVRWSAWGAASSLGALGVLPEGGAGDFPRVSPLGGGGAARAHPVETGSAGEGAWVYFTPPLGRFSGVKAVLRQ